jgi:hypothetical protein
LLVANGNTNRFQERRTRRRFINTSIPYFPAEVEHRLRGIDDVSGSLHTRTNQDDLSLRHSKEDHQTKEKERHDARSQQSSAYYNKERFGHSSKICRKEEEQQEEIHEQNRHKKNVVLGLQKNEKSTFDVRKQAKDKEECTSTLHGSGTSNNSEKWDKKFEELVAFKEKFGHSKIPNHQREYRTLRNWIGKQREAYKTYQISGKGVTTISKRIKKLQMIGVSLEPYSTNWSSRFQQLVLFHREHGHCTVPQQGKSKHTRLGQWLGRQKKDLRPSRDMGKDNLVFTKRELERARLLESVGVHLGE